MSSKGHSEREEDESCDRPPGQLLSETGSSKTPDRSHARIGDADPGREQRQDAADDSPPGAASGFTTIDDKQNDSCRRSKQAHELENTEHNHSPIRSYCFNYMGVLEACQGNESSEED